MKIIVETNGNAKDTIIYFDDVKLLPPNSKIKDFHLSIHYDGKVKLRLLAHDEKIGKIIPISLYGDDFKIYDEANKLIKKENENGRKKPESNAGSGLQKKDS